MDGIHERYVILEGRGRVELGEGLEQAIAPGDVVVIPAQTPQRVCNTGDTDLVFLAVCSPRFLPEAYRDLLMMRLVEGLTGPEIAQRLDRTPGSVRVSLHRGMALLRAELGVDDV